MYLDDDPKLAHYCRTVTRGPEIGCTAKHLVRKCSQRLYTAQRFSRASADACMGTVMRVRMLIPS